MPAVSFTRRLGRIRNAELSVSADLFDLTAAFDLFQDLDDRSLGKG